MKNKYFLKLNHLLFCLLFISTSISAQFYKKHFIAPTTWNYFTEGNEFVIATQSTSNVVVTITKSDGTPLATVNTIKGAPSVYRPVGSINVPRLAFNTILNNAGVIISATSPISVEQRNIVGVRSGYSTATVNGNALLISFGNAGLGKSFRIGYYRDDAVISNFGGPETPTYSVMATQNNTNVYLNNALLTTLNTGQSYLFKAPIGSLVTASDFIVVNVSSNSDSPETCADATSDQVPPISSLGNRYMMVRGKGNKTAEQITVIASEPNTTVTLNHYNLDGSLSKTEQKVLANPGNYSKFSTGGSTTAAVGSVTEIKSTANVVVYAGTGDNCEVDIVTGLPVSPCSGSFEVESTKFKCYTTSGTVLNDVPYFGYLYLTSATDIVTLNGVNLEITAGARRQLGTSGIYLIDFDNGNIGSPATFDIKCNSKFNMELVQSGLGYGMASFFSGIADIPETPTLTYNASSTCNNYTATLTGDTGYAFYKWFVDDVEIAGATSNIHLATRTGTYTMGAFLPCGQLVKSLPVNVTLCSDVAVTQTVDNSTPDMGSTIVFTIKASNTGNNSKEVTVSDILSDGLTFVSALAAAGTNYNNSTGLWTIGNMEVDQNLTLSITATVKNSGNYTNTATITSSAQPDSNMGNNTSSLTIIPQPVTIGCEPVPTAIPTVQPSCGQNGTIEITAPIGAAYEYKLNNGNYQASPIFTNIDSGTYTVTVRLAANPVCVSAPATVVVAEVAAIPAKPTTTITQPTCSISTGTITITAPTGAVAYSIDGTNYQTLNVFSNVVSGNYNVTARNSNDTTCISEPTNITINTAPITPSIPVTKAATNIGCNVFTANWEAASNATYYLIDVSTDSNFNTYVLGYQNFNVGNVIAYPVSGLITGTTYYYRVRAANTNCISTSSSTITAATSPSIPPTPIANAGTSKCSEFIANWADTTRASGYFIDVSTVSNFSSFVPGYNSLDVGNVITFNVLALNANTTYYYRIRAYNGCGTSPNSNTITIKTLIPPNPPTVGTITQPTCTELGKVTLNGLPSGNWTLTVVGGTGNGISGTGTTTTITNLNAGTYNVLVTDANGCTSAGSTTININPQPPTPSAPTVGTITHPTCTTNTGSVVLSGLPSGNWTINPGAIAGIGESYTIAGLTTGTYNFTATNSSNCISVDSANVVIDTQPETPSAPIVGTIVNPSCSSLGSAVLSGLPAGNWKIIQQTGENLSEISGTGTQTTITGLLPGNYRFTVVNSVGCFSALTPNVTMDEISNPGNPTLGGILQPSCNVNTGSVTFNNLPTDGVWTINQTGPINNTYKGSTASFTASNLVSGIYKFELVGVELCTGGSSQDITINEQPATPTAPIVAITQPTCTSEGVAQVSGLPSGNWVMNFTGTITKTIAGSETTYNQTGLFPGTYNLTVTNNAGCTSTSVNGLVVNPRPITPNIPIVDKITQPNCTDLGIVELSGLPEGTWILKTVGGTGTGITNSGHTATIDNLLPGIYNITVTNSVGCTSNATDNIAINTQPPTPETPIIGTITQPTCSLATGSVILSGLPIDNWTINPGAIAGTGGSYTVTGITPGNHTFTVTNSDGCVSSATTNVFINTQPPTPSTPIIGTITQPTCSSDGTVELSGLPVTDWELKITGSLSYSILGSGTTYALTGLTGGTYQFAITYIDGCTSAETSDVIVTTRPATPSTPTVDSITQPTCTALGIVALSGLPSASWTLTVIGGTGSGISGSGTTTTISNLTAGIYNVIITDNVSGCTSTGSTSIKINPQPPTPLTPTVGIITQPTCTVATGSVLLSGLPLGNWIINPGAISGIGNSYTVTGLISGSYNFTVTNSSGCISSASANVVINAQPVTPVAPIIGVITAPTCSVAGSVILSGLPTGNWTLYQSGASIAVILGTTNTTTLSGLVPGTYNYRVSNSVGCTSSNSANVVIPVITYTGQPTLGSVVHPTCSTNTGTITFDNLPNPGTWTINQTGQSTNSYSGTNQSSLTIPDLLSGTYHFDLLGVDLCTGASGNVTINPQPPTPIAPIVNISQPNCTEEGIAVISGLPATGEWTLNVTGTVNASITGSGTTYSQTGLSPGTYQVSVTNAEGCTSAPSVDQIINTRPITPDVPLAVITQPTCSTEGIAEISGLPTGNWTINVTGTNSSSITGTGTTYSKTGLLAGTYNISVTNDQTCTSNATDAIAVETRPATPTAPMVGTITQPNCDVSTGSVVLSGLPLGNWTINPGQLTGSGTSYTVIGLATGTYQFTVTNDESCVSVATADVTINVAPEVPSAPTIGVITQPTCTIAIGSVTLNGLPIGNWVINPGAINGSGASYTISGLITGTYNFTVTNSVGCKSVVSDNVNIETQPSTPFAPTIDFVTQPTCATATGGVELRGLPSGNWIINPGAISGSGTSYFVNGLATGTYNFTVTNADGCVSNPSANVVINTQPATPSAPIIGTITQLTCSIALGTITLNGLPSGNWTIYPVAISGTGSSYTVTGLIAGEYQFTVTNAVGCMSNLSAKATINAQPATPSAPTIDRIMQPSCDLALGSTILGELPSGNWVINPGAIAGTGVSYKITGLTPGDYSYTVTASSGCTSLPSANVTINTPPAVPLAPIVTVDRKTATITGIPEEIYSIDNSNFTDTLVYNDLSIGTHTFIAKNSAGCISPTTTIIIEEPHFGDGSEIVIYNGISPNGDGKNDFFHVKNLENYPDNSVEIFDSNGKYVYKGNSYDNQKVVFTGSDLTIGVYYYIIRYLDKNSRTHTLSGNLYINR